MVIDVNMDEGLLDGVAAMSKFLRIAATEPDVSKVPFMIDSSKFEIIEVGLQNVQVRDTHPLWAALCCAACAVLGAVVRCGGVWAWGVEATRRAVYSSALLSLARGCRSGPLGPPSHERLRSLRSRTHTHTNTHSPRRASPS